MNLRSLTVAFSLALAFAGLPACDSDSGGNERWVTTKNTNADIDWDAISEAYKKAEGPEDFERRVNEIYTGDEVISISVSDKDDRSQTVAGFFDKNKNGQVEEEEKIFEINREITSVEDKTARYQVQGYNHYAHYRSPFWDVASGVIVGSMISRAFMPTYTPMYRTAYVTPTSRTTALATQRNAYRAKNPSKFPKSSSSGKSYGSKGRSSFSGSRSRSSFGGSSRSGGGFGVLAKGRIKIVRLTS